MCPWDRSYCRGEEVANPKLCVQDCMQLRKLPIDSEKQWKRRLEGSSQLKLRFLRKLQNLRKIRKFAKICWTSENQQVFRNLRKVGKFSHWLMTESCGNQITSIAKNCDLVNEVRTAVNRNLLENLWTLQKNTQILQWTREKVPILQFLLRCFRAWEKSQIFHCVQTFNQSSIGHFVLGCEAGSLLCRIAFWDCFGVVIAYFLG